MTIWMESGGDSCGSNNEEALTIWSAVYLVTDLGNGFNSEPALDEDVLHTGSHSESCQASSALQLDNDNVINLYLYNSKDSPVTLTFRQLYAPE